MQTPRWLLFSDSGDVATIRNPAVAIQCVGANQYHIGILYRPEDTGPVEMIHLAWHYRLLRGRPPQTKFAWVEVNAPAERLLVVEEICNLIHDRYGNHGLPYGLNVDDAEFDEYGHLMLGSSLGLTCATFVMLVFKRCRIPLLSEMSWRPRPSDRKWARKIIQGLERSGVAKSHIEDLRATPIAVRFKPSEVAASCSQPPADFHVAACLGRCIERALDSYGV